MKGRRLMMKSGITLVIGMALLFGSASFAAVTPQQKCQQAKLKAQGKYQACIKKNAAGVIGGKDDAATKCLLKFQAAKDKADAKAAAAVPATSCRYIDNGDGTVSDLNTALVWEKKTASGIHNVTTTYTWASSGTTPNGTAFTGLLGTLNGGTSIDGAAVGTPCFTGHCDWRLPTIQELNAISDTACVGEGGACIDPAFGPTLGTSLSYWSATTDDSFGPDLAWVVESTTFVNPSTKPTPQYVRAVRGGL